MDNLENYLYLIFAVIYILVRVFKKKQPKDQAAPAPAREEQRPNYDSRARPAQQPKKTMTFEDILKEFEKNLGGEPLENDEPEPARESQRKLVPAESVESADYQPYQEPEKEVVSYDRPAYEKYQYQNVPYENSEFKHELSYDLDKQLEFLRSKNYELQKDRSNEFIDLLKEPGGARKALILGEIFNRKYF